MWPKINQMFRERQFGFRNGFGARKALLMAS